MAKLPRLHKKHNAWYYVYRNKWKRLSDDYTVALQMYAKIMAPPASKDGMPALIDRWLVTLSSKSSKTVRSYTGCAKRLSEAFEEFHPSQVKPRHLYEFLDHYKITPSMSAHFRSVMVGVMNLAVREGLVDRNLMREVEHFSGPKRERLITDGEYQAIFEKASPTMRAIMTICYQTGQRIGDVLAIRYADIDEDGITFKQSKTGNRVKVAMTDDLKTAIDSARALHQSVKGLTLFHTRQGTPLAYWTIRTLWGRATSAAKVNDAHLHDLRAKAATDAKAAGQDSKTLLGHASESAHKRYLRSKEIPVAQPVKKFKS